MEAVGSPEYWVEFRVITGMKFDDVKRLFGEAREDAPPDEYIYDLFKNYNFHMQQQYGYLKKLKYLNS